MNSFISFKKKTWANLMQILVKRILVRAWTPVSSISCRATSTVKQPSGTLSRDLVFELKSMRRHHPVCPLKKIQFNRRISVRWARKLDSAPVKADAPNGQPPPRTPATWLATGDGSKQDPPVIRSVLGGAPAFQVSSSTTWRVELGGGRRLCTASARGFLSIAKKTRAFLPVIDFQPLFFSCDHSGWTAPGGCHVSVRGQQRRPLDKTVTDLR